MHKYEKFTWKLICCSSEESFPGNWKALLVVEILLLVLVANGEPWLVGWVSTLSEGGGGERSIEGCWESGEHTCYKNTGK